MTHATRTEPNEPVNEPQVNEHVSTLLAGDPARLVDRVDEILGRQIELFTELEKLSEGQRELIETRETEALLALLSRRSNVIHRLDRVGSEFEPFRARWSEVKRRFTDTQGEQIESVLAQLEAVASRVAACDEHDRVLLEGERDLAAREFASVKQGSAAVAAYGSKPLRAEPRFHDREG